MNAFILAAEAALDSYPGDDFTIAAWILAGVAFVITAIATVVVTPRAEHH